MFHGEDTDPWVIALISPGGPPRETGLADWFEWDWVADVCPQQVQGSLMSPPWSDQRLGRREGEPSPGRGQGQAGEEPLPLVSSE